MDEIMLPPMKRLVRGYKPKVPCELRFEYTVDCGETWLCQAEFLKLIKDITTPIQWDDEIREG